MPERIRLSRRKGWRMPPDTIKVDRSTRWGNPVTRQDFDDLQVALAAAGRSPLRGTWQEHAVKCFDAWLGGEIPELGEPPTVETIKAELRGKNLACWCSLDSPCHADVLLAIAND